MSDRATPSARSDYPIFYTLESRWADNDIYGHINNVAYYAYFDSVVNRFLIEEGGLRPGVDTVVGYVVHSSADYFFPASYPATLALGLKVLRIGEKSVRWESACLHPMRSKAASPERLPTRLSIGSRVVQRPFPKEFDVQSSRCLRPTDWQSYACDNAGSLWGPSVTAKTMSRISTAPQPAAG